MRALTAGGDHDARGMQGRQLLFSAASTPSRKGPIIPIRRRLSIPSVGSAPITPSGSSRPLARRLGGRSQHAGAATHYRSPVHMTGTRGGPLTVGSRWIWHAWDDARSTDQSGWVRSDHHASQAASPCQTSNSFFILRCADCVGAENWGAQSVRALLSGRALHIRVRERRDHTVCDLARTGAVPARAPV